MTDPSYINDIRTRPDFKGVTFSGYKLGEVLSELNKSLLNTKIEEACYWSAELICSGHLKELWNCILTYYSKHINHTNPKLSIYIHMRFQTFLQILKSECAHSELLLRNTNGIRTLFSEIMCVLSKSSQGLTLTDVKIHKDEFDCISIKDKLRAPNVSYLENVFNTDDPKELFIAVNELCFQISSDSTGGIYSACYWVEWIMEYSKYCKSKNQKCICVRRPHIEVDSIHQMDCVWLIWDALILYGSKKENKLLDKILDSLCGLYCIGYNGIQVYTKRKYIIYCAISYLFFTDSCNNIMITETTKQIIPSITSNINKIYQQIKKSEHAPNTDYLFSGLSSKTKKLEDTLNKLRMVNSVGSTIPTNI
jgi:hypothetical protein